MFSLHVFKLKSPKCLPIDQPFGLELTPDVLVPPVSCGRIDDFIDDLVAAGLVLDD